MPESAWRDHARRLVHLERFGEAEEALLHLLKSSPQDLEAHYLLAQLRHIRGDKDFARSLHQASQALDSSPRLRVAHADLLRMAGQLDDAEELLRDIIAQSGLRPDAANALGLCLMDSGRYEEAVYFTGASAQALPDNANAAENHIAALLAAGEARAALPAIERIAAAHPEDLRWITYRADVARHCGESHFDEWCNLDRVVRTFEISPPAGYRSIEEFHGVLRPAVEALHPHPAQPLDQCMRNGTQTRLGPVGAGHAEPSIQALCAALAEPIRAYQAALGYDPTHPMLARNTAPAEVVAYWSVLFRRGGYNLNHIHPWGWVSAVYYVSVPGEVEDRQARSGWLKFGEPTHPTPAGKIAGHVQPRPGLLVLFPAYLWHGTVPIRTDESRLSIAFDAVPRAA